MKAMILAAGLGTRLRPLTLDRPKPAMPLLGKPLVLRIVERLMGMGVEGFRINLHHMPESIESILARHPGHELPVSFSHEAEILGTAGGLKANEAFFDDETLLMVNGKIVMEFPLEAALAFHRERRAFATLILYPQNPPYAYSPIRIDEEGRLREFKGTWAGGKLRDETFVFTGIHIVEPEVFGFIPPGVFYEINDRVYPLAMKEGKRVFGFPVEGFWTDPSTPGRYLAAQKDLLSFRGTNPLSYVSPEAEADATARIGRFVGIEDGCVLGADSSVDNSILWDNVRLRRGSSVRSCIIGSGVTIDGEVENRVITRYGEAPLA